MSRRFPKPRLAIATLVATIAALVAGYVVLVRPQRQEAAKLAAQIDEARAELAAAQSARSGDQDLQPIRVADLFQLSRAMPDQPDAPDMLLQLSQIATETGITFKSITPADPIPEGSYEKLPIDLVFQGHFYDLSDFLYRLRNLVGVHDGELDAIGRLFSVDEITFGQGDVAFPQVEAQLRVDAYMFAGGTPATTATTPAETGPSPAPSSAGTAVGASP